ncbi:MAG: hypothetical protein AAFY11_10590 [Cyanobacteria bacterium J06641_5]
MTRAPKGTVQVIESHGRLQLRFRYAGVTQQLTWALPRRQVSFQPANDSVV